MKHLIFGTPAYNEAEGIQHFLTEVDKLAGSLKQAHSDLVVSMMFVDDGSQDQTVEKIVAFKATHFQSVTVHSLSRNFGPYPAITALFEKAEGDALIILDADLQDSLTAVVKMVDLWYQGYENVRVIRGKRKEGLIHQINSRLFYKFFGKVSGLQSGLGTFGLYDRKVVEVVSRLPEKVRYIPGMITLIGFKTTFITADREQRFAGESRVGLKKLIQFAVLAIFSFSSLPVHFITIFGFITAFFSMLIAIGLIVARLAYPGVIVTGWTSLICAQFFLGGIILFSLGVLGQYISIIFNEIKGRPIYLIRESKRNEFKK